MSGLCPKIFDRALLRIYARRSVRVLKAFAQAGTHYLLRTDFGCKDDVDTGWITIEAESESDARLMVPPIFRNEARVMKLPNYTADELKNIAE